jgi:tetratricopeptide (TPR) repeat protein
MPPRPLFATLQVAVLLLFGLALTLDSSRLVVAASAASASASSSSASFPSSSTTTTTTTTSRSRPLPPFVSHVDDALLQEAIELAQQRHERAVQAALDSYPTHLPSEETADNASSPSSSSTASSVSLTSYNIVAPGRLPDFAERIPRRVMVTEPPLLSRDECRNVVRWAEQHFQGKWPTQKSGDYDVAGCWIKDVPEVKKWFLRTVQRRLFPLLAQAFPDFVESPEDLCVDQTYLFKYTAETGGRTGVHTDAGCLSFTLALNDGSEYEGGGTWFEGLQHDGDASESNYNNVLEMRCGQVAIRPGGVKHAGHAVRSGVRYVIGGFCMNRRTPESVRQLLTPDDFHESGSNQLRALEAAVALNPHFFGSYTLLANEHKRLGNLEKAQQILEYCLAHVHPLAGEAAYSLGMMYLDQGRHAQAHDCFELCLKDDPSDTEAMMALAQLCNLRGDTNGEERQYQRVLATPGTQPRVRASAYCNLGVLHEGDDLEIEYYQKALELRPDGFQARFSLASALASREQWSDAVRHFRRALDVPDAPPEHAAQALELLYVAAVKQLQSSTDPPTSQQEAAERIQGIIGAENYAKLVSRRQSTSANNR